MGPCYEVGNAGSYVSDHKPAKSAQGMRLGVLVDGVV